MDVQQLKEIITAHRAWLRNERGGRRADLSLKVLRDLNLKGLNLPKAKLTGIQLINCDLSGANLRECDLFAANLAGSRFIGGTGTSASCRSVSGIALIVRALMVTSSPTLPRPRVAASTSRPSS